MAMLCGFPTQSASPVQGRQLIGDPNNTIFVSAVSPWEIWLKKSTGKLRVPHVLLTADKAFGAYGPAVRVAS
jgi:PIN domain nuclease of toxin-antitoxin system